MKVEWSPSAALALESVYQSICELSPHAAEDWIENLNTALAHVSRFPLLGRMVPELDRADVREVLVSPYRVVYRLHAKRVQVLAVRHYARRDPGISDV